MSGKDNLNQETGDAKTLVESVPLELMKHPLEHTWTFWLNTVTTLNPQKWEQNLVELTSFDTVEDYWCLYHHVKLPSELLNGQDYAVFKQGIRPMWEDHQNKQGGRWLVIVDKGNTLELDRLWVDVVLLMIGENFEDADMICGAVVKRQGET